MAVSFLKGQFVNNSASTVSRLLSMYRNSTLSDVQLIVGGAVFSAHKLILSMCSDVFKTMLTDMKWPEAYKDQITLTEEPECIDVFEDFIEYMYTGHIHLSHLTVLPVLTLADKYNVKDLSDICVSFMCDNIDTSADSLRVVSWLQYARLCNYHKLESLCAQYTEWNFQKVAQGDDFLSMSAPTLFDFLSSSDLVVHNEYSLFLQVKKWFLSYQAHCKKCPYARLNIIKRISSCLRFSMMTASQLELLCQDPFVLQYADVFKEKVMEAFKYHSVLENQCLRQSQDSVGGVTSLQMPDSGTKLLETSRDNETSPSQSMSKTPRNYTCEDWSCELILENFDALDEFTARTFFFSTPRSNSATDQHVCWDWQVELYPKGVRFPRAILIGIQENYEIDQHEHTITRLGVKANCVHDGNRNVEVSVVAKATSENGLEYVRNVIKKKCIFDFDGCLHNLDNIVPYDELQAAGSVYLTENEGNTFKILVIIKPLS